MKKYKIVHRISADFIAEAIVNEDEIDTSITIASRSEEHTSELQSR